MQITQQNKENIKFFLLKGLVPTKNEPEESFVQRCKSILHYSCENKNDKRAKNVFGSFFSEYGLNLDWVSMDFNNDEYFSFGVFCHDLDKNKISVSLQAKENNVMKFFGESLSSVSFHELCHVLRNNFEDSYDEAFANYFSKKKSFFRTIMSGWNGYFRVFIFISIVLFFLSFSTLAFVFSLMSLVLPVINGLHKEKKLNIILKELKSHFGKYSILVVSMLSENEINNFTSVDNFIANIYNENSCRLQAVEIIRNVIHKNTV